MIINKDYMMIMRQGKLSMPMVRKQNNAGLVLGACMMIACIIILVGIFNH
jgi:hypothetical protein